VTIKDILLHLGSGAPAQAASAFALSLAQQTGAHVTAASVVIDVPAPDPAGLAASWDFTDFEAFSKIAELRRGAAEKAFAHFAASAPAGVTTESVVIESYQERARDDFARLARHFDLLVIARNDDGAAEDLAAGEQSRVLLSSALFGSGRPVFVIPPAHDGVARLDRALVCWDAGMQAARAISAATPLLALAKSVEVVCVAEDGETAELPGFNITRHLARHGVSAALREIVSPQDTASALLEHARASGADFLVMGGYGHWRVSELILGGTTRTILDSTPLPVFMAH